MACLQSAGGALLRFVEPLDLGAVAYESQIFQQGAIVTRSNPHDYFNALCWLSWPNSKIALNAAQWLSLDEPVGANGRSRRRDALTLLDECGVVLAYQDPADWHNLQAKDWPALFVSHRSAWGPRLQAFTLGHALCEQALKPFIGLTAKTVGFAMPAEFFSLDPVQQRQQLDEKLAEWISQPRNLPSPASLPPLPVLGIPDWWPAQTSAFYANTAYFRTARSADSAAAAPRYSSASRT